MIKHQKAWGTKGGGLWFLLKRGNKNNRAKTETHWLTLKSDSEISKWILLAKVIPVSRKKESNRKLSQERACRISTVQNQCHRRQSNFCGITDIACHYVSLCRSLIFLPHPSFLFPSATGESTWDPEVFIIIIIIFPFWWLSFNKHSISLIKRVKGSFISPPKRPPVPPIFGVLLKRTWKNTWELRESEKGQSEGRKHI